MEDDILLADNVTLGGNESAWWAADVFSQLEDGSWECAADAGVTSGERMFRFAVHGVLLNGVGCAGLLGNALAGAVLSRPQMRSSTHWLLAALAACDSALIVASILLFGLPGVYPYTGALRHYYRSVSPRLAPYAFPLALVAQTMSVYLTLIVTLERWVAVCHPLRARALCTPSRARLYVLATFVFSLAYNVPKYLEVEVVSLADSVAGDVLYCVTASELRSALYVTVYVHWLYLVVMYVIPFGALAVLNARIVRQVRRAQRERARLSRVQRRELSLATVLVVVVLVFFVCNVLPLVTNACEAFLGAEFQHLDPLIKTSNLLVTINSSVNFLVYVIFGDKFKRVFFKTFCAGRVCARDSPEHSRDDSFASERQYSLRASRVGGGVGGARRGGRTVPAARPTELTDVSLRRNGHT